MVALQCCRCYNFVADKYSFIHIRLAVHVASLYAKSVITRNSDKILTYSNIFYSKIYLISEYIDLGAYRKRIMQLPIVVSSNFGRF